MKVHLVDAPPTDVRTFEDPGELADKLTPEDVEIIREIFNTPLTGSYNWDYESANAKIRRLYELGKSPVIGITLAGEHRPERHEGRVIERAVFRKVSEAS